MSSHSCAWFVGLMIAASSITNAKEPVSIRVTPTIGFAPADLNVRISVQPDAGNRALEFVADSETFYRSSLVQLEGDRAPITTMLSLHGLPRGEYVLLAVVIGADGQPRGTARTQVHIIDESESAH